MTLIIKKIRAIYQTIKNWKKKEEKELKVKVLKT